MSLTSWAASSFVAADAKIELKRTRRKIGKGIEKTSARGLRRATQ